MDHFFNKITTFLITAFMLFTGVTKAQDSTGNAYVLSIEQAVQLAKLNNDHVTIARLNSQAAIDELKEVKSHALPHIVMQASGKRLTNVTLYEHGLQDRESLPPPPSSYQAAVGVEATFNLYSGGKHEAAIKEQEARNRIADINVAQQQGSISLQVVQHYLEILRLSQLDSLYKDQIDREKLRLKNINSLYKNGKVTRSDVLRAEISLSNQEFAKKENESDIEIFHNRLNILMHLPQEARIILSDTAIVKTLPPLEIIEKSSDNHAYSVRSVKEQVSLQQSVIKGAKSNYMPTIELVTEYGYNYPNYLRYPYVDQLYAVGFVGVRMQYNISSLYQNSHKVSAERNRLEEIKTSENATRDNVTLEITSLKIKISDTQEKIALAQKNIEQSQVNYRIVSTKYFNQLALLTDLLEADNIYLQSKYKLIEAQTSLLDYYYQTLYTTGKL